MHMQFYANSIVHTFVSAKIKI